jgi:hypothetical protein
VKSLTDVVSGAGLHFYAEVALILFFAVFIAIGLRLVLGGGRSWDHAAHLPLEDDVHPNATHPSRQDGR